MSISLSFSDIRGTDLINQDTFSLSDPYVIISAPDGRQLVQTEHLQNEVESAVWPGPFTASVATLDEPLRMEIIDRDRGQDDPMGHVQVSIPVVDGMHELTDLALTGVDGVEASRLSLKVSVEGAPKTEVAHENRGVETSAGTPADTIAPAVTGANWWEAALPAGTVTRKEIRRMPAEEQRRVRDAYMKMRENKTDAAGNVLKGSCAPPPMPAFLPPCPAARTPLPFASHRTGRHRELAVVRPQPSGAAWRRITGASPAQRSRPTALTGARISPTGTGRT